MVDSVASVALETLRDLLVEETKLLVSVSGEVEQVKRDLIRIHGMLMKADRKGSNSPTLKECVNQLKDLAHKAETVLETYAVKVASKKESHSLKEKLKRYSCILCECSNVHEVGKDVRRIISRLAVLKDEFESELGQESSRCEEEDLTRLTLAHEVEPHFVGMEKEIEDLVSMVTDERGSERVVIKVYGMGGLGKTTLARKVYNHGGLASYARAWACVTQNFQPKSFLGNILRQLEKNEQGIDSMDVSALMDRVCSVLGQRKTLLVIDDIWEDDHWEMLKNVVPKNCKVLLTTRNEKIANQESHSYKLKLLTVDEGWDLLKKISLAPPDETKSLEKIGRDIVVKCGRLPLSISVIGGILRQKEQTLAEWEKVNTSIGSYLRRGEGVEGYKRVEQVLELSYDALPYYLKSCFLYLACFAEDQEIKTERLYLLWMAEGFISHEHKGRNESLTDVAERYLSELAMRCMVQVEKTQFCSPFKKFDSCRLHDLMHDLCSSKAEEENLLKRLEVSNIPSPKGLEEGLVNPINRLAIINDINDSDTHKLGIKGLEEVKDLRSFMLLKKDYFQKIITFEDITMYLERSPCLRILVVEGCEFEDEKLPNKVGKLIHLRYLSLGYSTVRELPKFVCGMPYLQTLDLRVIFPWTMRLPNEIRKMKKLKHLFLSGSIEVIGGEKLRLDGLEELETLDGINSETACIADIPKLMMSLRKLRVTVGDMDSMSTVLHLMSNNNDKSRSCELKLTVQSCNLSRDVVKKVLMFPGLSFFNILDCNVSGGFPCYEQGMAQNLVTFSLHDCKVRGEDMNVNVNVMEGLGNYPILQRLVLYEVDFDKTETFICPSNSFPQLHHLSLSNLRNIKKWEVEEGAMPKLVQLFIRECRNMEKLPDGLRFISTLEELNIDSMPEEFKERVRGQDSATVSHIPYLRKSKSAFN